MYSSIIASDDRSGVDIVRDTHEERKINRNVRRGCRRCRYQWVLCVESCNVHRYTLKTLCYCCNNYSSNNTTYIIIKDTWRRGGNFVPGIFTWSVVWASALYTWSCSFYEKSFVARQRITVSNARRERAPDALLTFGVLLPTNCYLFSQICSFGQQLRSFFEELCRRVEVSLFPCVLQGLEILQKGFCVRVIPLACFFSTNCHNSIFDRLRTQQRTICTQRTGWNYLCKILRLSVTYYAN